MQAKESDADEICQSDIRRVVSCHCEHDFSIVLYGAGIPENIGL